MLLIDQRHIAWAHKAVNLCASVVAAIGVVSLGGTVTGLTAAMGFAPVRYSTSVAFMLMSACLILVNQRRLTTSHRNTIAACGSVVLTIGAVGLAENAFAPLLHKMPELADAIASVLHPGSASPMPVSSAALMILSSVGVMLRTFPQLHTRRMPQYVGMLVAALSMVPVLGYSYRLPVFVGGPLESQINLLAAATYCLIGAGLVLLHPVDGPAAVVLRSSIGGSMARRLLPALFLVPVIGLVANLNSSHDLALVLLLLLINFGLPVLIWALATTLEDAESEKNHAFQQIGALNHELNRQVLELLAAKDQAQAAVKTRSQFVANVSHELRTPLSGIIGVTELLQDTRLDQNQKELLGIVQDSSHALLTIINDILDFSKMEAHKMQLEKRDFELSKTLDSVTRSLRNKAFDKNLQLNTRMGSDVPDVLRGDSARLRQVVSNLIDNAIKFTEKGSVSLDVTLHDAYGDKVVLRFAVTDSGIGISPETVDKLFQPFVQADGSFTRKYGGTGLGLSICKTLVELMGGQMGVTSSEGQGSTFWFELPFESATSRTGSPTSHPVVAPAHQSGLVLIAEDNAVNAKIAVMQLKKLGYAAEVARTGSEAIAMTRSKRYSLILMDVQMPDKDGFEATAEIREFEKNTGYHVPITAMTAHAMQGDRERCLNAGMDDYITKPVNLEVLRDILDRWVFDEPLGAQVIPFRQRSG